MERFEHGGDAHRYPGALDFSASLNPLGMPASVIQALRDNVDHFSRYPDPACRQLTEAIARAEEVDASQVVCCAGATDAIARICQVLRPRRALLLSPCYSGYEQALEQLSCEVVYHDLSQGDGFLVDERLLEALDEKIDLVFLANPNNPTGRCVDRSLINELLSRAKDTDSWVVLDECFIELANPCKRSNELIGQAERLIIVKALTKSHSLAGLRLGYALASDTDLIQQLIRVGQPWAVSGPAQLAGVTSLTDTTDYLERARALIASERARLSASFETLGLRVVPSDTNYLLFSGPTGLFEPLAGRGVLVRRCDNFRGLGPQWYRVAVRMPEENDALLTALGEVLE